MRETSFCLFARTPLRAFLYLAMSAGAIFADTADTAKAQNLGVSEIAGLGADPFSAKEPDYIELDAKAWEGKSFSAAELLSKEAGIQMKKLGGMGSFETVSIRGASAKTVLICIDGIPLEDGGGTVSLGGIDLNQFERIEIYKNYAPARFGGNAIGGVVNFISKPEASGRSRILASYGSHHSEELSYSATHNLTDSIRFSSQAGYRHSDNDYKFTDRNGTAYNTEDDTVRTRQNAEYSQFSGTHSLRKLHAGGSFSTLAVTHSNEWGGNPGKESNQTVVAGFDKSLAQAKYRWESSYESAWRMELGVSGRVEKSVSHSYYPLDKIGYNYDSYLEYGTISYVARPEAGFLYERQGSNIQGGLHLYAEAERFEPRDNNKIISSYRWNLNRFSGNIAGDFSIAPAPFCTFKWDFSTQGDAYKKSGGILFSPISRDTLPEARKKNIHWAGRASLQLGKADFPFKGFASVAKYYRAPKMTELYGVYANVLSNPELKAETGINWEAGARFESAAFKNSFQILYFETAAENGIVWVTSASFAKPLNFEKTRTRGIEAEWENHYLNLLEISLKGTIQDPRNLSEAAYYKDNYLPNEPVKSVHFALTFHLPLALELSGEAHYRSRVFCDRANRERIPSQTIWNASLARSFETGTRLVFAVNNISDEDYQDIYDSYPKPGREFKATWIQDF